MKKVQEQLIELALQAEKEDTASAAADVLDKEHPGLVAEHLLPPEYLEKWPLQQEADNNDNNNINN